MERDKGSLGMVLLAVLIGLVILASVTVKCCTESEITLRHGLDAGKLDVHPNRMGNLGVFEPRNPDDPRPTQTP